MTWAAVGVLVAALAGQTFWISHALNALRSDLGGRLDRVEQRLDGIEQRVLSDYGERIARLEERTSA